jgi:hypothetical protein
MPMPTDYETALNYLDANKSTALSTLPPADQARVVRELRDIVGRLFDRKPEDLRAAVTMAVDAAKTLTAIGIAFFVAVGGFMVQYVGTHDSVFSIAFWSLTAAGLAGIISMVAGFYATGTAFKNAQGIAPATATTPAWSTVPLKRPLTVQSWAGLAGLAFFAVALLYWSVPPHGGLAATPVPPSSSIPSVGSKIRIEGTWSSLTISRGGLAFTPPPSNQVQAFDVELR